jgi:ribosomal protein S6--L-glutamate ligase
MILCYTALKPESKKEPERQMDICFIMDNPETPRHPVIAVALQQLSTAHSVRLLDVRTLTGDEAIAEEKIHSLADLYLLKSHAPQALDVTHYLEQQGALVVNSWAASSACQNRVLMAQRMLEANIPGPQTQSFATLEKLLADSHLLARLTFPLIIKSCYSHRGDLVDKIHNVEQLQALAAQWSQEPIVLQEFVAGDGRAHICRAPSHTIRSQRIERRFSNCERGDTRPMGRYCVGAWPRLQSTPLRRRSPYN